jgi:hypothetical protein
MLDKRLVPASHPLYQFTEDSWLNKLTNPNEKVARYGYLKDEIPYRFQRAHSVIEDIYQENAEYLEVKARMPDSHIEELGKFIRCFPRFDIKLFYKPLTRAILRITMILKSNFDWTDRWSGKSEPFWIIIDNEQEILHSEYFILHKKDLRGNQELEMTFFVPYEVEEVSKKIADGAYYNFNFISDRWYGIHTHKVIELGEIAVPDDDCPHTKLKENLKLLHISSL